MKLTRRTFIQVAGAAGMVGCAGEDAVTVPDGEVLEDFDSGPDEILDADPDAPPIEDFDAAVDDAALDDAGLPDDVTTTLDAGADAGADVPMDTPRDVPRDLGVDVPRDVPRGLDGDGGREG